MCSWKRLCHELREQSQIALPTLAGLLISKIPWFVTLRFVGLLGSTQQLAAAALAMTLRNLTGLSLSVGLSSALATLTAQSRGDLQAKQQQPKRLAKDDVKTDKFTSSDDPEIPIQESTSLLLLEKQTEAHRMHISSPPSEPLLPLIYLYRAMVVQLLFVLPMIVWWMHGLTDVLVGLGQGPQLSQMTAQYLQYLAPGLVCYSVQWTLVVWLQNIDMAFLPAYTSTVATLCHVPLNIFWIHYMEWGYLGAAMATTTYEVLQPVLVILYVFGTPRGRQKTLKSMAAPAGRQLSFWPEGRIAVSSVHGILQYLGLALPGLVSISEWWASEMTIFLAGRLQPSPDLTLGAMTIFQCINTFCFMVPVSVSIAGAARVGSLLGAGDADGAHWASRVSVTACAGASAVLGILLYWIPHDAIPSLFAPHQDDLIRETSKLIPLLALYVLGDGVQTAFNGVIKGSGRQAVSIPVVLVAYWAIGVPLAYYLAFIKHPGTSDCDGDDGDLFCGVVGLVTGTTTGTYLHMMLFAVVVLRFTDFTREAEKAQERLGKDGNVAGPPSRSATFATEHTTTNSSISENEFETL